MPPSSKLSRGERAACAVVERVLGVHAEPWDVGGRQGAVDALLHYPDGRVGAFEHSILGRTDALELDARLSREQFEWPLPGDWWWSVTIGHVDELNHVRSVFDEIVLLCESYQVSRPDFLSPQIQDENRAVRWLLEKSTSRLSGHPTVSARDGTAVRTAMVVPPGHGGAVDSELAGLGLALHEAFTTTNLRERLDKLLRHDADERHLFVPIHETGLPYPIFDGLAFGECLPPSPPPLPDGISHLWLAPNFSRRVVLWAPGGWQQHTP